mmetsp:Transcript_5372/g.21177  ORF Transcript_5372/g.21177 Transcript_5372/m.21177 type:complete len:358 (-) Transcript_5372:625-1698(-)
MWVKAKNGLVGKRRFSDRRRRAGARHPFAAVEGGARIRARAGLQWRVRHAHDVHSVEVALGGGVEASAYDALQPRPLASPGRRRRRHKYGRKVRRRHHRDERQRRRWGKNQQRPDENEHGGVRRRVQRAHSAPCDRHPRRASECGAQAELRAGTGPARLRQLTAVRRRVVHEAGSQRHLAEQPRRGREHERRVRPRRRGPGRERAKADGGERPRQNLAQHVVRASRKGLEKARPAISIAQPADEAVRDREGDEHGGRGHPSTHPRPHRHAKARVGDDARSRCTHEQRGGRDREQMARGHEHGARAREPAARAQRLVRVRAEHAPVPRLGCSCHELQPAIAPRAPRLDDDGTLGAVKA